MMVRVFEIRQKLRVVHRQHQQDEMMVVLPVCVLGWLAAHKVHCT